MRNLIIGLIIVLTGCSKTGPITGAYQTEDKLLSAVVMDSSLFLMINPDTMFIYELHLRMEAVEIEDTFRIYEVSYVNSLNRSGYDEFDLPIKFTYDQSFGGILQSMFINNDKFEIGGYFFYKEIENGEDIFNRWSDLFIYNTESKMRIYEQNN